ncbi:60S ribosomal protein L34 [Porphyridium purpureum]|uniref:60S ribosomal protein L34 n=1 Tax=Porphyridium purpureum TaxID=35688 RepID=A0A5J4YX26_PORPP|nr:60S ribosomal protein L34 [Porphyridium purpureum]|eukprot:POR8875..scf209_3
MADKRVTLRRRHSYATKSNRIKKVKTPGAKLVVHYHVKRGKTPVCGDTGERLNGIKSARPAEKMRMSRPKKNVSRVYGGHLSGKAVRDRIVRAFLIEEQKIVKKVLKSQKAAKNLPRDDHFWQTVRHGDVTIVPERPEICLEEVLQWVAEA